MVYIHISKCSQSKGTRLLAVCSVFQPQEASARLAPCLVLQHTICTLNTVCIQNIYMHTAQYVHIIYRGVDMLCGKRVLMLEALKISTNFIRTIFAHSKYTLNIATIPTAKRISTSGHHVYSNIQYMCTQYIHTYI